MGHTLRDQIFFDNVVRALQDIVGDCAKLSYVPLKQSMERTSSGRINTYIYLAEITYSEQRPQSSKCKCSKCWTSLKAAIDNAVDITIHRELTLNQRMLPADEEKGGKGGALVYWNPYEQPVIWERQRVPGGGLWARRPPAMIALWHELMGHAYPYVLTGNANPHWEYIEQNGRWVRNTVSPEAQGSEAIDPAVAIENEARACLIAQGQQIDLRATGYYDASVWHCYDVKVGCVRLVTIPYWYGQPTEGMYRPYIGE